MADFKIPILRYAKLVEEKRVRPFRCDALGRTVIVVKHNGEEYYYLRDIFSHGLPVNKTVKPLLQRETDYREFIKVHDRGGEEQASILTTLRGIGLLIDHLLRMQRNKAVGTSVRRLQSFYDVLLEENNNGKLSVKNRIYDVPARQPELPHSEETTALLPKSEPPVIAEPANPVAAIEEQQQEEEEAMLEAMSDEEAVKLGQMISWQVANYVRQACILREHGVPNAEAHFDGLYGLLDKLREGLFPEAPARVA